MKSEKKTFLIVAGGKESNIPKEKFDYTIACDKGYEYCKKQNVTCNFITGDFDSLIGDLSSFSDNIQFEKLPCEKDDTDTLHAVRKAIEMGASSITITCALGNRFDHSLANIQVLSFIAENKINAKIIEDDEELFIIDSEILGGKQEISKKEGFSLSVFSISEKSIGVSISGTKYKVQDAELSFNFPIGISNEWEDEKAVISVKSGRLLIIESRIS